MGRGQKIFGSDLIGKADYKSSRDSKSKIDEKLRSIKRIEAIERDFNELDSKTYTQPTQIPPKKKPVNKNNEMSRKQILENKLSYFDIMRKNKKMN